MDYTALIAKWPSVAGATSADKLANLNAQTVAGPNVDVPVSAVVGKLMLSGAYLALQAFSQGSKSGNATHDNALAATQMLVALITVPNAPMVQMSDPTAFATVKGMMDAILAQEAAVPGSTGFTQAVHDALLALAATTQSWCRANGYPSYSPQGPGALSQPDLLNAGLS